MANKKISELEPGQEVVNETSMPGSLGAQTFKYTAEQIAAFVQSKDTAGDIDGPLTGAEVVGIRGRTVSPDAPTNGQALRWNGTAWIPASDAALTLGGDLSGSPASATVTRMQGRDVSATAPTNGQTLQWDGTAWVPTAPPAAAFTPVVHEYSNPVSEETLTIPTGATLIDIVCIGAGGGGGSGRRGAASSVRCGGGGGGGGGFSFTTVRASNVTGPLKITVGTGGTGAAGITLNDANGNSGNSGTASFVTSNTNAVLCRGNFGAGGFGGSATSGTGGGSATASDFTGTSGNPASTSGGTGQDNGQVSSRGASGGGAGGGITNTNLANDGSSGGLVVYGQVSVVNRGTVANPAGTSGYTPLQGQTTGGGGGGGGASSLTTVAGAGGNGTRGGGGGGGGASVNGNNSGAGGNGGNGYVRIIFY